MANEITASVALNYADSENTKFNLAVIGALFTVSTKGGTRARQQVTTTPAAVNLGGVASPGYAVFINRDLTNSIDLKTGSAGQIFARLDPDTNGTGVGGMALVKLGSGAQVPYCVATAGTPDMDILILSA